MSSSSSASFVERTESSLHSWGVDTAVVAPVLFLVIWWGAFHYTPENALAALSVFGQLSFIWLPFLLLYVFWDEWVHYVWSLFLLNQKHTLLDIRLPQEILKSPRAMELFLTTLFQGGRETTFIDRLWLGKVRMHFSLEIASFEGDVHFFIRTPSLIKDLVESRLYAQYPEAEVHDVPDYTREVVFDEETMELWGIEYKYTKPDPYPILTYVDFGLDKDPKEEHKVDPLSHVVEYFASMKAGEYMWLQMIIRNHKSNQHLGFTSDHDDFKDQVKEEIAKILASVPTGEGQKATFHQLSERDKLRLAAIQTKESKPLFEVGMRALYMAKKESFRGGNTSSGLHPLFRHLQSNDLNTITNTRGMGTFDYFWQDPFGTRRRAMKHKIFKYYQQRAWFWVPYSQIHMVMNTEELATLFHFPGQAVSAPTLRRISSRKGGAPSNLPV